MFYHFNIVQYFNIFQIMIICSHVFGQSFKNSVCKLNITENSIDFSVKNNLKELSYVALRLLNPRLLETDYIRVF